MAPLSESIGLNFVSSFKQELQTYEWHATINEWQCEESSKVYVPRLFVTDLSYKLESLRKQTHHMFISILLIAPVVVSKQIPADKGQVNAWFEGIIKPMTEILKSCREAIHYVVGRSKKKHAKEYGTVNNATLIAESNYFVASNLNIVNLAPKPEGGKTIGGQVVALRVSGDRSPIYNYNIYGFQETCDDKGNHFFKDCYVLGTVDFIFGSGKSLYLNTNMFVEKREREGFTVITTQARESSSEDMGYSSNPRVVYAFTDMSNVVNTAGWSHNRFPERA
ncbi:hypothetical protein Gogos_019837, partial [Gossypium gossypioides]|nr:hypothetical protein [Gossypium gossypioides]